KQAAPNGPVGGTCEAPNNAAARVSKVHAIRGSVPAKISRAMATVTSHHADVIVIPSAARKRFVRAQPPATKTISAMIATRGRRSGALKATTAASIAITQAIDPAAAMA